MCTLSIEVKSDGGVQTLETKNIIVATGSGARMLPGLQPDSKAILTNIEILDLPSIPKTMPATITELAFCGESPIIETASK